MVFPFAYASVRSCGPMSQYWLIAYSLKGEPLGFPFADALAPLGLALPNRDRKSDDKLELFGVVPVGCFFEPLF
jgi:hypothetical protein